MVLGYFIFILKELVRLRVFVYSRLTPLITEPLDDRPNPLVFTLIFLRIKKSKMSDKEEIEMESVKKTRKKSSKTRNGDDNKVIYD